MRTSAFGVEDNRISKADNRRRDTAVAGAAGTAAGAGAGTAAAIPAIRRGRSERRTAAAHTDDAGRYRTIARDHERQASFHGDAHASFARNGNGSSQFSPDSPKKYEELKSIADKARAREQGSQSSATTALKNAKRFKRVGAARIGAGAALGGAAAAGGAWALRGRRGRR